MKVQEEIERKYEVDENTVVPPLAEIAEVVPAGEVDLEAEYFDTEGGDLAAHHIVLRRRRGGEDEGWHIKVPSEDGRTEYHWPLAEGDVPAEVLAPVLVIVRDRPLRVIARLHTRRTLLRLVGDGGDLLEIADDVVSASDTSTGVLRIWREWEVELLSGAPESKKERTALFDAVEERLLAAGATPAASGSKLASALGRTTLAEVRTVPRLDRSSATSAVLIVALRALVDDLVVIDPRVRRNEPDSVHLFRTRVRRLRSLFASYRHVFDREATDPIREELRDLGVVLGRARDAEVMRDRAHTLVADHDVVPLEVGEHIAAHWDADYLEALDLVVAELSGTRYFRLLDTLDGFIAHPVLTPSASGAASDLVPVALDTELTRVLHHAKLARAAASGEERTLLLHETRKAAKRLRYAAEAVSYGDAGVFGKKARRLASAAEAVHDLLGEYRDSELMQQHLRELAQESGHAFEYGVLFEIERHSAALCLMEYPAALAELKAFR